MDAAHITELYNRVREAARASTAASDAAHCCWQTSSSNPDFQAASAEYTRTAQDAQEAHYAATDEADRLINSIENEAEAARRAVLERHAASLTAARETIQRANETRDAVLDAADAKMKAAREAYRRGLDAAATKARETRDAALLALVLAVTGGPVRIPASPKRGRQSKMYIVHGNNWWLQYQWQRRGKYSDAHVDIILTVRVSDDTNVPLSGVNIFVSAPTLDEAQRKAEEQAVAAGWLVIERKE